MIIVRLFAYLVVRWRCIVLRRCSFVHHLYFLLLRKYHGGSVIQSCRLSLEFGSTALSADWLPVACTRAIQAWQVSAFITQRKSVVWVTGACRLVSLSAGLRCELGQDIFSQTPCCFDTIVSEVIQPVTPFELKTAKQHEYSINRATIATVLDLTSWV